MKFEREESVVDVSITLIQMCRQGRNWNDPCWELSLHLYSLLCSFSLPKMSRCRPSLWRAVERLTQTPKFVTNLYLSQTFSLLFWTHWILSIKSGIEKGCVENGSLVLNWKICPLSKNSRNTFHFPPFVSFTNNGKIGWLHKNTYWTLSIKTKQGA